MMGLEKSLLRNRQQILDRFARALRRFDQDYPICSEGASPVRLADAITLVIQPRGRGKRPEDAHVHAPGTPGVVTGGRMSGTRHAVSVPACFHRESPLKRGR